MTVTATGRILRSEPKRPSSATSQSLLKEVRIITSGDPEKKQEPAYFSRGFSSTYSWREERRIIQTAMESPNECTKLKRSDENTQTNIY
ncbi:hypothetical protein AVEN_2499-1 [Araneus ventricosus]|uniref:Uncharacterized protein n=1 Tax=Araneus ventricosus TaxID=182803 RepID=A0A4Y2GF04_ARAVE|nr:hypothetical protein AVEN_2499-1 [Araneus ventricosus]